MNAFAIEEALLIYDQGVPCTTKASNFFFFKWNLAAMPSTSWFCHPCILRSLAYFGHVMADFHCEVPSRR